MNLPAAGGEVFAARHKSAEELSHETLLQVGSAPFVLSERSASINE